MICILFFVWPFFVCQRRKRYTLLSFKVCAYPHGARRRAMGDGGGHVRYTDAGDRIRYVLHRRRFILHVLCADAR